jgi:translation initiation factor IF-3
MARAESLDLVEVAPQASPPVCKVMDYGKYKYQKSKRDHEAKRSQHVIHIKEIKLRPTTDEHDINFKLNHARKFLESRDKVKVTLTFRGREMAHLDLGRRMMERLAAEIAEFGTVEQSPKLEGRLMVMILAPKH